jgi:hypothetical protein
MVDLVVTGVLPQSGFVRQEQVTLADFLANRFGQFYAGHAPAHGGFAPASNTDFNKLKAVA